MKRHVVIGASSGTGNAITGLLAKRGDHVIAISRRPSSAQANVTGVAADVRDAAALSAAFVGEIDTVFYTVDIHGFRKPKAEVHSVMVLGCINAMEAAVKAGAKRFVLLSVIGAEQSSFVWSLLDFLKPGMQANVLQREHALERSGLPYIIVRAPRLDDGMAEEGNILAPASSTKLGMKRSISRQELARLMIEAVDSAKTGERSTWDVVKQTSSASAAGTQPQVRS